MVTLKQFIELDSEAVSIRKRIEPETARLAEITKDKEWFNSHLTYEVRHFICQKLWDNMSSTAKEQIEEYRKKLDEMLNPPKSEISWATVGEEGVSSGSYSIQAIQRGPFDPFNDEWWVVKCEEDGDKVRLCVSCKKNEDSISGLMVFLDEHYTVWFDKKEIENI